MGLKKKVAVGCQGGGMHAAFQVGVLTEILKKLIEFEKKEPDKLKEEDTFELVFYCRASRHRISMPAS